MSPRSYLQRTRRVHASLRHSTINLFIHEGQDNRTNINLFTVLRYSSLLCAYNTSIRASTMRARRPYFALLRIILRCFETNKKGTKETQVSCQTRTSKTCYCTCGYVHVLGWSVHTRVPRSFAVGLRLPPGLLSTAPTVLVESHQGRDNKLLAIIACDDQLVSLEDHPGR